MASPIGALERALMKMGEGVGSLKKKTLGGLAGDAYEGLKSTGKAMKEHPRAAIGGGVAAAGAAELADRLEGDELDDDEKRRLMLEYIRNGEC